MASGVSPAVFFPSSVRSETLARQLGDPNPKPDGSSPASFVHTFRFTRIDHLSDTSAWDDAIWQDWQGESHALFKGAEASDVSASWPEKSLRSENVVYSS